MSVFARISYADEITLSDRPGITGMRSVERVVAGVVVTVAVYEARFAGFAPQGCAFRDPEHPVPLATHEWTLKDTIP